MSEGKKGAREEGVTRDWRITKLFSVSGKANFAPFLERLIRSGGKDGTNLNFYYKDGAAPNLKERPVLVIWDFAI